MGNLKFLFALLVAVTGFYGANSMAQYPGQPGQYPQQLPGQFGGGVQQQPYYPAQMPGHNGGGVQQLPYHPGPGPGMRPPYPAPRPPIYPPMPPPPCYGYGCRPPMPPPPMVPVQQNNYSYQYGYGPTGGYYDVRVNTQGGFVPAPVPYCGGYPCPPQAGVQVGFGF